MFLAQEVAACLEHQPQWEHQRQGFGEAHPQHRRLAAGGALAFPGEEGAGNDDGGDFLRAGFRERPAKEQRRVLGERAAEVHKVEDQCGEQFAERNLRLASGAARHGGHSGAAEHEFEGGHKPEPIAPWRFAGTGVAVVFGTSFLAMLLLGVFGHPKRK